MNFRALLNREQMNCALIFSYCFVVVVVVIAVTIRDGDKVSTLFFYGFISSVNKDGPTFFSCGRGSYSWRENASVAGSASAPFVMDASKVSLAA